MSTFFPFLTYVDPSSYSVSQLRGIYEISAYDEEVVGWRFTLCTDCELSVRTFIDEMPFAIHRIDVCQPLFTQLAFDCAAGNHCPHTEYSMIRNKNTYYARGFEYGLTRTWRQHSLFPYLYYKTVS